MTDEQPRGEPDVRAVHVVAPPPLALPAGSVGAPSTLAEQIASALRMAVASGDLDTARALHVALAGALGVTQQPSEPSGARVVPLRGRGKGRAR